MEAELLPFALHKRREVLDALQKAFRERDELVFLQLQEAVNFTKNIAKTYGERGVRANCVCPGAIETDVLAARRQSAAEDYGLPFDQALEHVMFEEWKMPVAVRRVGQPNQVGELMAFCLSERAGYMTGAVINIDGGTDF